MSQAARIKSKPTEKNSTKRHFQGNQNTSYGEKNGSVAATPIIIEVKGLKEATDNTKYVVATMGNFYSTDNDQMMEEQTEPLNKDHVDGKPKDVDGEKVEDRDNDVIANNNENPDSKEDDEVAIEQDKTEDSDRMKDEENDDKILLVEEDSHKEIDSDKDENETNEIVETKNVKNAEDVTDQNGNDTETDKVDNKTTTQETDNIIAVKSAVDETDKIDIDERVQKHENSKTYSNDDKEKDTLGVPGRDKDNSKEANGNKGIAGNKNDSGNKDANGNKRIDSVGDDDAIITVAGKDDVDAASTYSLFMEKDFRYYFQHPYCRLFFCYFVVFCNFLIYAEDPVAHSRKECLIPMVGNDFAFIGTRYPPNAWSLLKVLFWLIGIAVGMVIGKLLVHGLLFNRLFRLKMFNEDQGSWMIMFLITLITVFIMSLIYNGFLSIGGDATSQYRISDLMGVSNDIFMKAAACGTWCGDFFTAWMVTDIMLQEKLYPGWARPIRRWWQRGWNRIILFWIVVVTSSFVVIFVIATDYIQWDKLNRDFLPTNELSRAFLASFILVMDLMIVMQDWDFPHFMSNIDVKLPGVNTAHIRFSIPKCLRKESWNVHITGKWFNYGILFLVMILDMNMWKNQIFYYPYDYGQYTGPEDKIYTVQDQYSLDTFNETFITFAYRNSTINPNTNLTYVSTDTHMNSRYYSFHTAVKGIAFIPSLCMFITFGVLVWMFGRFKPSEKDPYAGRLKKRIKKKKRFSFRISWKRREEIRRKIHAVPKLLYFKRKNSSKRGKVEIEEKEIPSEAFSSDDKDIKNSTGDNIKTQDESKVQDKNETSGIKFPKIPKIKVPEVLLFWRKKNDGDIEDQQEQHEILPQDQTTDKDIEVENKNDVVVNVEVTEARKEDKNGSTKIMGETEMVVKQDQNENV